MIKKRIIILFLILVLCIVGVVYKKYYKIEFNDYHLINFIAAANSPNGEYSVGVTAYKTDVVSETVYLCMVLYNVKTNNPSQNGKIILWDKVAAAEVELSSQETDVPQYSVQAEWINDEDIKTNGRIVNIYKGYDYRRD